MGVMAALYGCVVVSQFAAQAALQSRVALRGRAVAVMEGLMPLERVFARNRNAAALGIERGMTRVEVDTFGDVAMLPRSAAEEEAAKAALREALDRFTPRMEERGEGVDWECVLDLSGTERLLGAPGILGGKIDRAASALGLECGIVLCANADAGLSLARSGRGVRVVAEGGEAVALSTLPVGVLGLDDEQRERFSTWGIGTLGELAALPEVALIARMGQAGRELRLRALGALPHLLEPAVEAFALEETLEFEEPVETLDPLLFCMNVMLERMIEQAVERALALASVTVSLWLERCADRVMGGEDASEDELVEAAVPAEPVRMDPGPGPVVAAPIVKEPKHLLGMASADASVRKAWHRAALIGKPSALVDEPPVRGEALRERLGIGHGQAMRREAAKLCLVRKDDVYAASEPGIGVVAAQPVVAMRPADAKPRARDDAPWGDVFERTVRPATPLLDRRLLLKMLQLDLEAHPAPGYVVRIRLTAEAGKSSRIQLGLFAPPMPEPTRFEDTHARLVSLVGEENVGRVRALDTHAAEAFTLERFRLPETECHPSAADVDRGAPGLALRRLRVPQAVRVHLQGSRIVQFWFEDRRYEIARCYGPWRSSGRWWGQEVWSSDAWDVAGRSAEGDVLLCLLTWDLLREGWSIHGIYD